MLKAGEGFQPEANEQRSLSHIDSRLRQLLPPEDYESVASSSVGFTTQVGHFNSDISRFWLKYSNVRIMFYTY